MALARIFALAAVVLVAVAAAGGLYLSRLARWFLRLLAPPGHLIAPQPYRFRDPELARMAAAARGTRAVMFQKGEIADALDHPIFFLLVLSIGVVCMLAILSWGAKAANLPGISALLQHP